MTKTSSSPPSVRSAKINHADDSSPPRASHFRTLRFRPRRDNQLPRGSAASPRADGVKIAMALASPVACGQKSTKIDDPASL